MGTYVPNTKAEQQKMLESCGFHSFDEMYACIPEELRLKKPLELPEGKSAMINMINIFTFGNINIFISGNLKIQFRYFFTSINTFILI